MRNFYDNNYLSDYDETPIIYMAYIGKYSLKEEETVKVYDVLKLGSSNNFAERDLNHNRHIYKNFIVQQIWKVASSKKTERKIIQHPAMKNILENVEINGEKYTGLIIMKDKTKAPEYYINMVHAIINNYKSMETN